jgi:peptide/nickel transport system permease protein
MKRALQHLLMALATVFLGGLLGASFVRFAPGFEADIRQLDLRLDNRSIASIDRSREEERNVLTFYFRYLARLSRGDLGESRALGRPVAELFIQRAPLTFHWVGAGLLIGWLPALGLAFTAVLFRNPAYELLATSISGLFLCVPSALVALFFLYIEGPGPVAIGLVVFPQVFHYVRNVLAETSERPHVLMAKARGLGPTRILLRHVAPCAAPPILALAGVSASVAFGAGIPIEVICDSPGLGQLAWEAALGRDLPLLVNLTVLVTVLTLLANSCSDLALAAWEPERL